MRARTKFSLGLLAAVGFSFSGIGFASSHRDAAALPAVSAAQADPTISIKDFMYNPAVIAAKVGQPITVTNNDGFNHTVTAKDGTFNVDVPGNGSVTVTVPKAGSFPYSCTYHPGQHNPASINVS